MKKRIEEILDKALEALRDGKAIPDILKEYPEVAEELAPLLRCAHVLSAAPLPQTESDTAGLMRVIAKITAEERQERVQLLRFTPRRRFMRIAASLAASFIIGWGTVNASANAVPGDFFYPVKLITEKVRFMLSLNHENRVELRITYSAERLKELIKKYSSGAGIDKQLLKRMLDEAKAALDDANKLNGQSRYLISGRVANLSHLQLKTLKRIEQTAAPAEKKILNHYIRQCDEMTKCCMMMNRSSDARHRSDIDEPPAGDKSRGISGAGKIWQQCPMMNNRN